MGQGSCGVGQGLDVLRTVCRAFPTTQEGMRYCEDQFLEVAQQHGLCRPSQTVLSLKDILELHASVVSPMQLTMPLQCNPQPLPGRLPCSSVHQDIPDILPDG